MKLLVAHTPPRTTGKLHGATTAGWVWRTARRGGRSSSWDRVLPRQRPSPKIGGHRRFPTGKLILLLGLLAGDLVRFRYGVKTSTMCRRANRRPVSTGWCVGLSPLLQRTISCTRQDWPSGWRRQCRSGARDHLPRRPAGGFEHCPVKLRAGRRLNSPRRIAVVGNEFGSVSFAAAVRPAELVSSRQLLRSGDIPPDLRAAGAAWCFRCCSWRIAPEKGLFERCG